MCFMAMAGGLWRPIRIEKAPDRGKTAPMQRAWSMSFQARQVQSGAVPFMPIEGIVRIVFMHDHAIGVPCGFRQYGRRRYLGHRGIPFDNRSEEHTSELQSLMRISYAVFCLKKKK